MKKITNLFYFLFFLALSFPAKAFGMADLYGSPQVAKYGPPMQLLYGVAEPTPVEKITAYAQLAAIILIPIAIIVLIILGIRKMRKKK